MADGAGSSVPEKRLERVPMSLGWGREVAWKL
jgi:hypothetical protein